MDPGIARRGLAVASAVEEGFRHAFGRSGSGHIERRYRVGYRRQCRRVRIDGCSPIPSYRRRGRSGPMACAADRANRARERRLLHFRALDRGGSAAGHRRIRRGFSRAGGERIAQRRVVDANGGHTRDPAGAHRYPGRPAPDACAADGRQDRCRGLRTRCLARRRKTAPRCKAAAHHRDRGGQLRPCVRIARWLPI